MAKNLEISYLLDFYGKVLTDKQRDVMEQYYNDDLSLAEIADNFGISRQGVRDSIKRAEAQLREYEEKLGLAKRFVEIQAGLDEIIRFGAGERRLSAILNKSRELWRQRVELSASNGRFSGIGGVAVVLATVYNNLNSLYQQGKIRKISLEGWPDRYDRNTRHDHLVCRCCGRLSDLYLSDLTAQLEQQVAFPIEGYDLKLQYLCPECRARLAAENALSEPDGS